MATSRRKTYYTVSRFRGRLHAASGRRFCIIWINKMVNKQVEKQIAELREDILLMNLELRVQMAAELREHLGKAVVTQTRETPESYLEELETRQLKDKEGKQKSSRKAELNSNHSETWSSEMLYPNHISPKPNQGPRTFLSMSSKCDSLNGDIRHTEIKHLPSEDHSASQQAQCGPISPSGDPAVCDDCKLTEESEKKKSPKNPFQMSTVSEEKSLGDKAEAEEDMLIREQWEKWLDKQEMKGSQMHEHQRNVQQKMMGPCASEKQITTRKKSGQMGTMKKITTYLREFFSPSETSKWEILKEED